MGKDTVWPVWDRSCRYMAAGDVALTEALCTICTAYQILKA